ncbi:F0F1 ATP synthase subunit delta [Halomonas sp.]|jgi:F-type H+-transporting ATPase subunit delta|uniref:F0F1 ATP synthase subunit delta n=1 Tax=Halomonas sp. TaxID=1486246 RepID=UPI003565D4A7
MAEISTVARPYTKAAFDYACEQKALDAWSELLQKLGVVMASHDVQELLGSPKLTTERRVSLAIELADVSVDDAQRRFLDTLGEKGRLPALSAIADQFERLRAEQEKRIEVTVVSAFELDDSQQQKLASALKKRLKREISITTQVDKNLMGGVVLRAGDTVIDGSVRGRLNRLSEALIA